MPVFPGTTERPTPPRTTSVIQVHCLHRTGKKITVITATTTQTGTQPTRVLTQFTRMLTQFTRMLTQPTRVLTQPTRVLTQPTRVLTQSTSVLTQPTRVFLCSFPRTPSSP